LWDSQTGEHVGAVDTEGQYIKSLQFSPDGNKLAASSVGQTWLLDVSNRQGLRFGNELRGGGGSVQFTKDGKTVITVDTFGAVEWDVHSEKAIRKWSVPEKRAERAGGTVEKCQSTMLSPDGKLLACRVMRLIPVEGKPGAYTPGGEHVKVYDAASGTSLFSSKQFEYSVRLAFSPDSRLLAVGGASILVLETNGKQLHQFQADTASTPFLFFSPDSRMLVAVYERPGTIECWNVHAGRHLSTFAIGKTYSSGGDTFPLAFSSDSKTMWFGHDRLLRSLDATTGKEVNDLGGHRRPVTYLSFSKDRKRLVSACDESIIDWDVERRTVVNRVTIRRETGTGRLLAVSVPLRRAISQDRSGAYILRDLETGKELARIQDNLEATVVGNPFSFAGNVLLSWSGDDERGGLTRRYDAHTGRKVGTLRFEGIDSDTDLTQAVSNDGIVCATCSANGRIQLINLSNAQIIREFSQELVLSKGRDNPVVYRLAYSPDNKYIASVFREDNGMVRNREFALNCIQIWDVESGQEVARLRVTPKEEQRLAAACLAISPDHRYVAFGSFGDEATHVWELASESERVTLEGHRGVVSGLGFSFGGRYLAAGSEDGTILLWDLHRLLIEGPPDRGALSEEELSVHWDNLGGRDGRKAEKSIQALVWAGEQSVRFIRGQLLPAQPIAERQIKALIQDLDNDEFTKRSKAKSALQELGERAHRALVIAAKEQLSTEARRRVEELLCTSHRLASTPRRIQQWRALEILERIGNQSARTALESLAKGDHSARLTQEAKASLVRLAECSLTP
jgi:WD40 repeat protein